MDEHEMDEHEMESYEVDPNDERLRAAYCNAQRDYREGGGHRLEPCVAAAVAAALLLIDPCDTMWMGIDSAVAYEYDMIGSRIWRELCDALAESAMALAVHERGLDPDEIQLVGGQADVFGFVPMPVVCDIVERSITLDFTRRDALAPDVAAVTGEAFDRIVEEEFGSLATVRVPDFPRGDEVARLVCQRVGSFPFAIAH